MKNIHFLITVFLLFSCDPKDESIDFLEPKPTKIDNSKSFKKHYRGYYKNPNSFFKGDKYDFRTRGID